MVDGGGRARQGPSWQHNKALIQRLLERKYGGDRSAVPTIDYLAVQSKTVPQTLPGVTRTEVDNSVTFKFGSKLPETDSWFQTLAGLELNWLFASISSPIVVQDTSYVDNVLRRILVPRAGQKVVVKYAGSLSLSVTVYGAARSYGEHIPTFKALSIVFNPETKLIDLILFEESRCRLPTVSPVPVLPFSGLRTHSRNCLWP